MKKNLYTLLFVSAAMTLSLTTSCRHTTLEDRAEKDAREFTERYCPTPEENMQRMDSLTFDRATHTFNYYYRLSGAADNIEAINKVRGQVKTALLNELKGNTTNKTYKDQGYNFRYIFHSASTGKKLFEERFTKKDYK